MTHDTCQSSTNVRVLGAGCMYGLWRTLCSGATGACMMAGWERRMPCGAARGAGTCAMRLDGAWSQHPAQVQVSHRSPRAPVVGVREGRGCRRRSGAAGRLAAQRRALGLRVDSVISFVNPIIRHTDSREQDTSVTRASFTRTPITAPPPGTRWANIWPKPARGPRVPAAISPLRSRRGERSPGRRTADPAHVRTAAAPHGDEPTENETSENGRTVAARDRRSRRSALAARSHRHEPDVGRAARHATDASCERAA